MENVSFSLDRVIPESPHVYLLTPRSRRSEDSANASILDSSTQESEKKSLEYLEGELSSLRHKIHCMQIYQNDIVDELNSCQEENKILSQKLEEKLKTKSTKVYNNNNITENGNNSTILQLDSSSSFELESIIADLNEQLKKTKDTLSAHEDKIYDTKLKLEETILEKQKSEEMVKEMKASMKISQGEFSQFEQDKRYFSAKLSEKESVIESLQQHIFQLQEILNFRKDDNAGSGDSLGKYFCPNKSLNSSANYSFSEEPLNLGSEVIDIQLRESTLALAAAEETIQKITKEFEIKKEEMELTASKELTKREETIANLTSQVEHLKKDVIFTSIDNQSNIEDKEKIIKSLQDQLVDTKKAFEMREEQIKLTAVKETKIKYGERFNSLKAEMGKVLQEEVDKNIKLKANLQDSMAKQSVLAQNLNLETTKSQELTDEIENHKRQRALIRSENLELQSVVYALKKTLDKRQRRVEELEQEMKSLRTLRHDSSDTSVASSYKSAISLPSCRSLVSVNNPQKKDDHRRLSSVSLISTSSNTSTSSGRLKAVPTGSGCLFKCEDEDDFQFNEKNIETLKLRRNHGSSILPGLIDSHATDSHDRFSELYRRNTMQPPHMKSCYPSEYIFCVDDEVDENNLKQLPGHKISKTVSGPTLNAKGLSGSSLNHSQGLPYKSSSGLPSPPSTLRRRVGTSPKRPLQYFKNSTRLNEMPKRL